MTTRNRIGRRIEPRWPEDARPRSSGSISSSNAESGLGFWDSSTIIFHREEERLRHQARMPLRSFACWYLCQDAPMINLFARAGDSGGATYHHIDNSFWPRFRDVRN